MANVDIFVLWFLVIRLLWMLGVLLIPNSTNSGRATEKMLAGLKGNYQAG
jgi:hypothetical protein